MNETSIEKGFILAARKFKDNEIMTSKPALFAKLWVWMLLYARYKDDPDSGLKRGQFFTSIDLMRNAMAYKVGYRRIRPTKKEIRDAYKYFTKVRMIVTTKVTHGMIITICNYNIYQNASNYEGHNEGHTDVTDIKKKGLKKERKRTYSDFVLLTDDECQKLSITLNGKQQEYIDRLNGYIGQIGIAAANKKYVSHYHTILNWWRKDVKEKRDKPKSFIDDQGRDSRLGGLAL